jgi:hypothetical protein
MVFLARRSAPHIPPGMKTTVPLFRHMADQWLSQEQSCRFFDIVNGFLIDAVAHWCVVQGPYARAALTDVVSG